MDRQPITPAIRAAILAQPLAVQPGAPERGLFHEVFRPGERNVCPGCGGLHWHVGRSMAECPKCATALPIVTALPLMRNAA